MIIGATFLDMYTVSMLGGLLRVYILYLQSNMSTVYSRFLSYVTSYKVCCMVVSIIVLYSIVYMYSLDILGGRCMLLHPFR